MKKVAKQPVLKPHVKKGEQIQVIAGKAKGQTGEVLRVDRMRGMVFVKDVNMQKRHSKPRRQDDPGGIIPIEGPLHLSNVLKYCPSCSRGVRRLCSVTADCKHFQKA